MVSSIDPSKPFNGVPAVKADLRQNLQFAKDEIEALQEPLFLLGDNAVVPVPLQEIMGGTSINAKIYGAIGDGQSHPVSQWLAGGSREHPAGYTSLAEIQAGYPHVGSLADEIDWAAIQKTIDVVRSVSGVNSGSLWVEIPAGHFVSNRSFIAGVIGATAISVMKIRGAGSGRRGLPGTRIRMLNASLELPAVVMQGLRQSFLVGVLFEGENEFPVTLDHRALGGVSRNVSDYLATGVSNERYKPYAGLAIDPLTADPGGGQGYTGLPYGAATSSTITVYDCTFRNFAVGSVTSPSADGALAERITFDRCYFHENAVNVANCGSQNREFTVQGCALASCHTMVDTSTYGTQLGVSPNLLNNIYGVSYQILKLAGPSVSAGYMQGGHVESTWRLGEIGSANSTVKPTYKIKDIQLGTGRFSQESVWLSNYAKVVFEGVSISPAEEVGCIGLGGHGDVVLEDSYIQLTGATAWPRLPFIYNEGEKNVSFRSTRVSNGQDAYTTANAEYLLNDEQEYRSAAQMPDKAFVNKRCLKIAFVEDGKSFNVRHEKGTANQITITGPSYLGNLTFSTAEVSKVRVDDVLFWRPATNVLPAGPASDLVPFALVTSVTGAVVTATMFQDPDTIDQTFLNPAIGLYEWVSKDPLIGTFTAGNAITFTRDVSNIVSPGDWISAKRGNWSDGYRVDTVAGSNVTLTGDPGLSGTTQEFGGLATLDRSGVFEALEHATAATIGEATAYRASHLMTAAAASVEFDATLSGSHGDIANNSGNAVALTAGTASIVGLTSLPDGASARYSYVAPDVVSIS